MSVPFVMKRARAWVEAGRAAHEGSPRGPVRELHLELTHRCNLKCVMCHHWETQFRDPASVAREMDLAKVRRLVESSRALDAVETVVVTGGEPWLRADIVDILEVLARGFPAASVGVLTNLANKELVRRRMSEAASRGLRLWLGSSIDGLEATHDAVRGQSGAFRGTEETLAWLRHAHPEVDVSFSFTIVPRNRGELFDAYLWSIERGVGFGAQVVVNHQEREAPETFVWKHTELLDVEAQIAKIMDDLCRRHDAMGKFLRGEEKEGAWLWNRLLYWDHLLRYAREPKRFFRNCLAGERFAMFDPEGNLFFCPVNKHREVGNLADGPFDALWASAEAEAEREFVASGRCDCWLNCVSNPVLDNVLRHGIPEPEAEVVG